ncbi:MAG: glucose-6-phosphate dehydrogenase assembly protein OpcA, partial [Candidatus Eremiobacteraeota bacterium]|nr:glucose-6-phosphate dehydrogenase assembly protein OpcA [Candidatus Eremiobacteraeota bacterium]
ERFHQLAKRAQTVICSSSVTEVGCRPVCDLIDVANAYPDIDIQDLAYLRLHPWQDLIAEFFDDKHLLEDLFRIRNVEIATGSDAEAYYLLGWLASRLEWSACGKNQMCNRDNEKITFSIRREGDPRRVHRVALMTDATTYTAKVLKDDAGVASVEVTGHHVANPRFIPIHGLDVAALVGRAIVTHRDAIFHATLVMTKHIIDAQQVGA